ncbi:transcription termination factor 4, mitochondrial-like [Hibiscus syriacus]|uniref:transcription termination factor 4, mitochondrial-like n=1 Tax=Hibiscus syriacus TaxID=106335 RepID=UPI0019220B0E|nr:transcription termination factor 4, mitochondrial-like [Hibiscus syriacus]
MNYVVGGPLPQTSQPQYASRISMSDLSQFSQFSASSGIVSHTSPRSLFYKGYISAFSPFRDNVVESDDEDEDEDEDEEKNEDDDDDDEDDKNDDNEDDEEQYIRRNPSRKFEDIDDDASSLTTQQIKHNEFGNTEIDDEHPEACFKDNWES